MLYAILTCNALTVVFSVGVIYYSAKARRLWREAEANWARAAVARDQPAVAPVAARPNSRAGDAT